MRAPAFDGALAMLEGVAEKEALVEGWVGSTPTFPFFSKQSLISHPC